MVRRQLPAFATALLGALLVALFVTAAPASGGVTPTTTCTSNDPYGCLSTTTTTTSSQTCTVSAAAAQVGSRVDATVTGAPAGSTINLLLNGSVVDSETTAAAPPPVATVQFSFIVPALPEGKYPIEAVGPAFRVTCLSAEGGLQVLGANASRGGGAADPAGGSLARTGFTVGGLLIAAVALLVLGRAALERSRRTLR